MDSLNPQNQNIVLLKITLSQAGLDVYDAIVNNVFIEFKLIKRADKPVDVAYIAGYMSRQLDKRIALFKNKDEAGLNLQFFVGDKPIETFNTKTKKLNVKTQEYFYLDVMYLISNYFSGEPERKCLQEKIGEERFKKLEKLRAKYAPKITNNVVKKECRNRKKGKSRGRRVITGGLIEMDIILNAISPKLPLSKYFQIVISTPMGGQPGKIKRSKN